MGNPGGEILAGRYKVRRAAAESPRGKEARDRGRDALRKPSESQDCQLGSADIGSGGGRGRGGNGSDDDQLGVSPKDNDFAGGSFR